MELGVKVKHFNSLQGVMNNMEALKYWFILISESSSKEWLMGCLVVRKQCVQHSDPFIDVL